jgi:hypothetical protein
MEGSLQEAPARPTTTRRVPTRAMLALVGVALAIVAVVAMTRGGDEPAYPVTQDGGLTWTSTTVHRSSDGARVTAEVALDGKDFPTADGRDDEFVMYQLAGGRFDTREHTDDREAERVLGFDEHDNIAISPRGDGLHADADAMPRSGEYTLSLDGTIEYTDVPPGTWELRAYVMDRAGRWGGAVAIRTLTIR